MRSLGGDELPCPAGFDMGSQCMYYILTGVSPGIHLLFVPGLVT